MNRLHRVCLLLLGAPWEKEAAAQSRVAEAQADIGLGMNSAFRHDFAAAKKKVSADRIVQELYLGCEILFL